MQRKSCFVSKQIVEQIDAAASRHDELSLNEFGLNGLVKAASNSECPNTLKIIIKNAFSHLPVAIINRSTQEVLCIQQAWTDLISAPPPETTQVSNSSKQTDKNKQ